MSDKPIHKKSTLNSLYREFHIDDGQYRCGLCGNKGTFALYNGQQAFCICPNGRWYKQSIGRKKWEGSSVWK